ncbi:2-hydroxyacid dehydrogenase [Limoniibacter endophyticus]|nr:glyoxylate/hydroxypyruvate reductase A [Limoniibacter endophyticus]
MVDANKGKILLSVTGFNPKKWHGLLSPEREVVLEPAGETDPSITHAVVWYHPAGQLAKLPNLKAIFSIGAGVDHIMTDPDLPDVPIVRVVAENLTQHMVEYVVWRVLDHHRQASHYRKRQGESVWQGIEQRAAPDVTVGIMGMGTLGGAVAKALTAIGFKVNGWSRSQKTFEGVKTYSGQGELDSFLGKTDILVVLLPLTPQTRGIINYDLLSKLRKEHGGPVLINAGRGKLQSDTDILRALGDGTLREASLDVFEQEPLPASSPLWKHPKVFITPHAAAESDPNHLAPLMLAQMDKIERGETPDNIVDRSAGY